MVYKEDSKYFRVCDDCGDKIEIQKSSYNRNLKKETHFCLSCAQKGNRNHAFGKSPWNKGLSKEVDKRVKQYCEHCSQTKKGCTPWNKGFTYEELKGKEWADEFKKKSSEAKKGKPNYRRRKSTSRDTSWRYFRKYCKTILYSSWVRLVLERDNFQCQKCGSIKNLEVHHIKPFRTILLDAAKKECLNLNNYKEFTDEDVERLRNTIIEMHNLEDGITLCEKCHKEIDRFRERFDG